MRTFAILFAFLPVILAYGACGDIRNAPVFETLLLIAVGIEICAAAYRYGIELSEIDIDHQFKMDFAAAVRSGDRRSASTVLNAATLFKMRGAA